jgi:hypothetical protein
VNNTNATLASGTSMTNASGITDTPLMWLNYNETWRGQEPKLEISGLT